MTDDKSSGAIPSGLLSFVISSPERALKPWIFALRSGRLKPEPHREDAKRAKRTQRRSGGLKVDGLPQDTRRVIVRSNTEKAHLPLFLEVEEGLVDPGRVQLFGGVGPVRAHQDIKVVCPHSLQARLDRFDDEAAEKRAPVHLV